MAHSNGNSLSSRLETEVPHLRATAQCLCGDSEIADVAVSETLVYAMRHLSDMDEGGGLNALYRQLLIVLPPRQARECAEHSVQTVLATIPRHYRIALVLREGARFTYGEIADISTVPLGTVRSRLARGRRMFAELL